MSTKTNYASELHNRGCNCAQAVACSFCQEFGISEDEMFRIAEGFGLGMGVMEMCGALSGMAMIIGLPTAAEIQLKVPEPKGTLTKRLNFIHRNSKKKMVPASVVN